MPYWDQPRTVEKAKRRTATAMNLAPKAPKTVEKASATRAVEAEVEIISPVSRLTTPEVRIVEDAPHTLLDGLLDVGGGMDHNGGAQTCFVGEDASLHTPGQSHLYAVADDAAAHSLQAEGSLEDGDENSGKSPDMGKYDDQGPDDIGDGHEGDDLFGNGGDPLKAADDDKTCQDHQEDAGDDGGNAEGGVHVCRNGIDLGHVADTEGGQYAEGREENGQKGADPGKAGSGSQTVPQIVHGAAAPFILGIFAAVVDAQDIFGIVGHHAEEGHDPHPEDGAGTAGYDGSRNAGDVAGADGGGQGRAQGLELADGLVVRSRMGRDMLVGKDGTDGLLHPVAEMGDLEELCQNGHQDAGTDQKDQHGDAPDKAVDSAVYICDSFDE